MASRKEQKEALREERLARERQAEAVQRRKKLVGYGVGAVVGVAALVAIAVVLLTGGGAGGSAEEGSAGADEASAFPAGRAPPPRGLELGVAARTAGCTLTSGRSEGNAHVPGPVVYRSNPPHSGNHDANPAEDGPHPKAPPTERLVHALEHGRIAVQFRPDVPDAVKGNLKALVDEDPYHMVITPNQTGMPFEVAATTWTQVLGCPRMNDGVFDAIRAFRDRYRDRGPEYVP